MNLVNASKSKGSVQLGLLAAYRNKRCFSEAASFILHPEWMAGNSRLSIYKNAELPGFFSIRIVSREWGWNFFE